MINKRILTLITLLLFLLLLVGCKAINQAPIITSIPITAVELGETYTYDVNATDPEGDTLTYSLITKPTGMTITSATGLIKWTSKAEGNFAVVVKVSDGVLYIIQSFTIVVSKLPDPPDPPPIVNYAPIITSIPGDTAIIGVAYLYDVNATDPEGDVLTYSLTKKPDDMTINSTTGLIGWTPAPKQIGNNPVIVKVSDGKKATTQSFTITVKAVEPDPEIELTGIEVDPKTMTLFVGESKAIKSVTAYYEIKGFGVPIPLGDCTYDLVNETVITVSDDGLVEAVGVGTATITVKYKDKKDTIAVTVKELIVVHDSGQNAINKELDHPYINWTIDGLCIEFEFVNPTEWMWAFDYRVDGEEGEITGWSDTVIKPGGELAGEEIGPSYNIVNMPAGEPGLTKTVTVCVEEEVWVGMRLGAENDWYLDWIKFEVR